MGKQSRRGNGLRLTVTPGTTEAATLLMIADDGPRTSLHVQQLTGLASSESAGDLLGRLRLKGLIGCEREGRIGWWYLTPNGMVEADRIEGAA